MKVVLTGGGTGGHVFPAISVGLYLKEQYGAELSYIGNQQYIEAKIAMEHHIPFYSISSKGLEGKNALDKYSGFAFCNTKGLFEAVKLLKKLQPDFVFATGGFVSAPVLAACQLLRIPYSIHEQNSVLGKVNKLFQKKAEHVFYSFPVSEADNVVYSGIPIRFNERLSGNGEKVVFVGGSGGSHYLNEQALTFAKNHPDVPCVLLTGKSLYQEFLQKAQANNTQNIDIIGYADDMLAIYKEAGVIICRSGAGTVFEIANLSIPAVFVPLPTSADDHQKKNALFFEQQGAAKLIEQGERFEEALDECLIRLLESPEKREMLKRQIDKLAVRDSAARISAVLTKKFPEETTQTV